MISAPGFGFSQLLSLLPLAALKRLAGASTVELLSVILPSAVEADALVKIIKQSKSSREYLADLDARRTLLNYLPDEKLAELCGKLNAARPHQHFRTKTDVCQQLSATDLTKLLDFFGASRAPNPTVSNEITSIDGGYMLFPHQKAAALRVQQKISTGGRVILHMPTGGGKTRTAMTIIADHLKSRSPTVVVWLAYSKELLEQAASEFEAAWQRVGDRPIEVGRFWGSTSERNPLDITDGIVVAGLGKLSAWWMRDINALPTLADRASLTVIDEAHQAIAETYSSMLEVLATKRRDAALVGLTATPGRTWSDIAEDARLAAFFGHNKVVLEIDGFSNPISYLIDRGYLARPQFRALNVSLGVDLSQSDRRELENVLDLSQHLIDSLVDSTALNLKILMELRELATRHQRIIFFSANVAQARLISAMLTALGLRSAVVTGQTLEPDRKNALQQYQSNSQAPMIICNYGVLTTGFDAPRTSCVLIARPTRSLVLFSQMVGRALRGPQAGGNPAAEVVTIVDPQIPGFGSVAEAFENWEDVWKQ